MRGFLTVRTRFLLALILPFIGVLGAGLIMLSSNQSSLQVAQQTANVVDLAPAIDLAIESIRKESEAGVQLLAGNISQADFDAATSEVDLRTATLVTSVNDTPDGDIPPLVIDYVDQLVNKNPLERAQLRGAIKAGLISPAEAVMAFGQITQALGLLPAYLADQIEDRDLASYLDAYSSTVMSLDSMWITNTLAEIVALNPDLPSGQTLLVAASMTANGNIANAERYFSFIPESSLTLPVLPESLLAERDKVLSGQSIDMPLTTQLALQAALQEQTDGYAELRDQIRDALKDASEAQIDNLQSTRLRTVLVFAAFLIGSIGIALLFARSILTPLSRLKTAAQELSDRLPGIVADAAAGRTVEDAPSSDVNLSRRDEIGALARAFSTVNNTAVQVAGEQATLRSSLSRMFVSIARRDSVLVNRQLAYLDEYERSEESPTVLSRLFALDHLATQMRRNNESLLIISGADTGTRFRGAVAMTDVIRSSISEIDQFERIHFSTEVNEFDRPMHGHVARHAIHLFAELLENATRYSPPTSAVQITARADGDIVRVLIRDQGIGMSDEELAEANARVRVSDFSDLPDVDRLGLSVVARLRARCNAVVDFTRPAVGEGILVCVSLPMSSFIIKDDQPQDLVAAPPAATPAAYPPADAGPSVPSSGIAPASSGPAMPTRQPTSVGTLPSRQQEPLVEIDQIDDDTDREAVQMFLNDMR